MWPAAPASQLTGFDPLQELRDIRLPDAVSWWPPAPGWWVVVLFATVLVVVGVLRARRYLRSPSRAATRELTRIRRDYRTTRDVHALAVALSIFLRRCVLAAFPRVEAAGLTGDAWLSFLDRTGATVAFSHGPGRVLISAPYQTSTNMEAESLLATVEAWTRCALAAERLRS